MNNLKVIETEILYDRKNQYMGTSILGRLKMKNQYRWLQVQMR